jgi:hypothetical protein
MLKQREAPEEHNRHNRVVVFLGAGASTPAGYRTFSSFPDLLLDECTRLREGLTKISRAEYSLLLEIRRSLSALQKPATHDNFLWALDHYAGIGHSLQKDSVLGSRLVPGTIQGAKLTHFFATTEQAIRSISETTIRHYSRNRVREVCDSNGRELMKRFLALYSQLARLNAGDEPCLSVFTTNYDMFINDLVAESDLASSLNVIDGFPAACGDGAAWDSACYKPRQASSQSLYLLRLHGCVCWYLDAGSVRFYRDNITPHRLSALCAVYPGNEQLRDAPPQAFARHVFHRSLLQATVLVTIGFSFRDDDVVHSLLVATARREPHLKLIVVDPYARASDVMVRIGEAASRLPFPVPGFAAADVELICADIGTQGCHDLIVEATERTLRHTSVCSSGAGAYS